MRRTTRTLTSRLISCIILAGILIAYYLPYYPSASDRWEPVEEGQMSGAAPLPLTAGQSYRLIRPTSRFALCADETCAETEILTALFSGGTIFAGEGEDGPIVSNLSLAVTGYGEMSFGSFSLSGQQGRYMLMTTPVWSGKVFVPGSIQTGDGVLSFLSSGYMDTRRLGRAVSFFDNPYQQVSIDRRFISQ